MRIFRQTYHKAALLAHQKIHGERANESDISESEPPTFPLKHIVVVVKIKLDQEKDVSIPQRKNWRHNTVEMLEGDAVKNFGTQDILNSPPRENIMTHTRFIAKQKIISKHFDREMRTFEYLNVVDKESHN